MQVSFSQIGSNPNPLCHCVHASNVTRPTQTSQLKRTSGASFDRVESPAMRIFLSVQTNTAKRLFGQTDNRRFCWCVSGQCGSRTTLFADWTKHNVGNACSISAFLRCSCRQPQSASAVPVTSSPGRRRTREDWYIIVASLPLLLPLSLSHTQTHSSRVFCPQVLCCVVLCCNRRTVSLSREGARPSYWSHHSFGCFCSRCRHRPARFIDNRESRQGRLPVLCC